MDTIESVPIVEPTQEPQKAPVEQSLPIKPPSMQFSSNIVKWANLIKQEEGASAASHNPGNLKYSSLTASWGASKGRAATDGGFLCQFPSDAVGMTALCNFLTLGAENELIAFHSAVARTLDGFTKIYAGNPPQGYINAIVEGMGGDPQVQISTFL